MNKYTLLFRGLSFGLFFLFITSAQASISSSQSILLLPGWNIISTPKVLDSHSFSVAETSANFDIYVLDSSKPSGWATLADLGQTQFTPLYGYFINNKTGANQTLTLNYEANLTPNQKLFSRTFTNTGWYSFGIANASYALPVGFSSGADTNNPSNILSGMSGYYDNVVDLTDGLFNSNPDTVYASTTWKSAVQSDINSLHDFRETKGYAIFINKVNGLYSGLQTDASTTTSSTISVTNSSSVASQNIAVNTANQILGGFTTTISGEPISISSMKFYVATSSTGSGLITSATIVDSNGAVVAGPVDAVYDSGSGQQKITFTDTVTLAVGAKNFTLKGRIPSSFANNGTVQASTIPSSDWGNATGQTTGLAINLAGNGLFTMNIMTVKTGSLAISVSSSPSAQNIIAGTQSLTFTNYLFDASNSGEDVRLSSLPIQLTLGGSATSASLSSCQLYDGATALNSGSNVLNPSSLGNGSSTSVVLDSQFIIPKATIKTLALKCNVSSSAVNGNTFAWGVNASSSVSVTGVTSGTDITETITASTGQTMTVTGSSFTASVDSSTASYAIVSGGSTGVNIGTFKFRASNETINLARVGLKLTSGTASDITQVSIWNGALLVGTATFTGGNTTATSTFNSALTLPTNTDVLLVIKADLASIGTGQPGTEGQLIQIDIANAEGTGQSSGSTITTSGITAGVNGVRMFKSVPVVALDTLPSTGIADGRLMRFRITSNSNGSIGIYNLNFTLATSSFASNGGVSAVKINVYSDSAYSVPVSGTYGALSGQFGTTVTPSSNNPTLNFVASTNPLQIPAGTTYYFDVNSTVTGVQTSTSAVTTIMGDSTYNGLSNAPSVMGNFVWSGNATTTAIFGDNDWSNSYGVFGLPTSGMSQTRSN